MSSATYKATQSQLFDSYGSSSSKIVSVDSEFLGSGTLKVGNQLLKTTPVFDSYWFLAFERQEIFFRRLRGQQAPWTDDSILRRHKFTNAYRAADRTSQYLIRQVIYRNDLPTSLEEVIFRILLFKLFNKIATWQQLEQAHGGKLVWADYSFERYDQVLSKLLDTKKQIYSAAYMMPPGGREFGHPRKHQNHLRLLERMMAEGLPQRLADAPSMATAFALLRAYPTIGDFLAYQYATDINYSTVTDFSETEFVMAGPGARDGIEKCFTNCAGLDYSTVIQAVMEAQEKEFDQRGLPFRSLWGRPLQLIDCQNLFCEVSKYARVRHPSIIGSSGRTRIKQLFTSTARRIDYFFPPKWNLTVTL
jgi:hypothetical protein